MVKKSESAPAVANTKDDEELKKSIDMERILVEDSLHILLGHDSGLNDVEYMLKLVGVNG